MQPYTFEDTSPRSPLLVVRWNLTQPGLRAPVEVLSWARGHEVAPAVLHQALRHLQVERVVTQRGYVSVQRFYIYAERGLARRRVSVWLYDGRLHIAHREVLLARYAYRYDRKNGASRR